MVVPSLIKVGGGYLKRKEKVKGDVVSTKPTIAQQWPLGQMALTIPLSMGWWVRVGVQSPWVYIPIKKESRNAFETITFNANHL